MVASACGRVGFGANEGTQDASPAEDAAAAAAAAIVLESAPVAAFSTASRTFVDVPGATLSLTPAAPIETWVVLVSARLSSTSQAADAAEARFLTNGVEQGLSGADNEALASTAAWQHFTIIAGTTRQHTVTVQLRDASGTATIDQLRLQALRLPNDLRGGSALLLSKLASASQWTTAVSVPIPASQAGDFLVLAEATGREAPCTTGGVGFRVQTSTGAIWPVLSSAFPNRVASYVGVSRTTRVGFPFARRLRVLPSAPALIELQARAGDAAGCEISYARVLAFPTEGFASASSAEDLEETATAIAAPVVKSSLLLDAGAPARYLVVQSVVLSAQDTSVGERRATFTVNGVAQASFAHTMDNENYRSPYGAFYVVDAPGPVRIETTFASGTPGVTVLAKESVIHALRL
jgi:hypothetical protein